LQDLGELRPCKLGIEAAAVIGEESLPGLARADALDQLVVTLRIDE
jgi:hypothetical protein